MEDPTSLLHRTRPVRIAADDQAAALRRELDATRAELEQETQRHRAASAAWEQERRGHEATRAALAQETRRSAAAESAATGEQARGRAVHAAATDVVRAAREVLAARPRTPAEPSGAPGANVTHRLQAVLEVLGSPEGASGADATREELARRFELVRALLD